MKKIEFFAPKTHVEEVKNAMFDAGAGNFLGYDRQSWQILGQGQFRPLEGAKPFIGAQGRLETLDEYKVELLCDPAKLKSVIEAMKAAHPYEVVAFAVWDVEIS